MTLACPTSYLHRAGGGIPRDRSDEGPLAYAKQLARYIKDASTIRAHVMSHYGRAPTLDRIRHLQAAETEHAREYRRASDMLGIPDEKETFRVRPIALSAKDIAALPKREPAPKPVHHFKPPESRRVRDQTKHLDTPETPAALPELVSWHEVVSAVARAYRISAADIIGPSRAKPVVIPRRVAMYVLFKRGRASINQIGRWLNRHHTSVMHNVEMFETCADADMRMVAGRLLGDHQ